MARLTPLLALAFGFTFFCGAMGVYMAPFQIGVMIDSSHLSASQSGLLSAIEIAAMSITAILAAPMLDRSDRGKLAIFGALIAAGGEVGSGFVSGFALQLPLRALTGVGCGLIFGAAAAATVSTENPDRSFGIGQAIMNLLFFCLYLATPHALELAQHRGLFLLLACIFLILTPIFRALPNADNEVLFANEVHRTLNSEAVILLVMATVLLNSGLGALWGYVERIGISQVGLTIEQVASVLSSTTLAMIAGSLAAGWLGAKYGRGRPMFVASVCCAIAALAVANATTVAVYLIALLFYNFAYLFLGPYIFAGVSSVIDPSGRLASAMVGVMFLSYSAGIASGGFITEQIGLSGIGWFAFLGCLISAPMYYRLCARIEV